MNESDVLRVCVFASGQLMRDVTIHLQAVDATAQGTCIICSVFG